MNRWILPAVGIVVLGGLAASLALIDAQEDPAPDGPVVAFYGDSYTLGTGSSDFSQRWSTIIARDRGWVEVNPSVNGLGFVNNRYFPFEHDLPGAIIDADPDIVVVTMGLNDNFAFDGASAEIKAQITTDLERLSEALPQARFVVVEPFWYTDERPASLAIISGWIEDAAAAIGADHIAGASRWIEGHPEWMAKDRLHPNDDGYAEMARRMDAELTAIGL
jgi:hypothetical protein